MPLLVDDRTRNEAVALAALLVMAREGVAGTTLRGIAREVRLSPACLSHQYGSGARLLEVAGRLIARDRVRLRRVEAAELGVAAFVPRSPDDVVDARSWQGWVELSRVHERLGLIVAEVRRWERLILADTLDHRLAPTELDALVAVVDGLEQAMTVAESLRWLARHAPLSI